jgi:signal transduction histidine kinase
VRRRPDVATTYGWLGGGRPPTTLAGAESVVVLLIVGTRLGMLLQGLPSIVNGLSHSPAPAGYAASWAVAIVAAVGVSVASLRRGRPLPDRVQVLDLAATAALLLAGPLVVSADYRIGSWEGWQPGYAVAVALSVGVMSSTRAWLVGLAAVVAAQVVYVAGAVASDTLTTTLGDLLTVVLLAIVSRAGARYLFSIAQDADDARARASELARVEEERRAQLAIHNGAALMHLLSDPSLDERARDRLIEQARHEATRMRAYLRGEPGPEGPDDDAGPVPLAVVVRRAVGGFDDLPVELALDLGDGVAVEPAVAEAVRNALTSLLLNVRRHADARLVVVHLDGGDEQPPVAWELVLHDDGRGFDPEAVAPGVGLREVVHAELGRHGVDVRVTSAPGSGTTVTLTGPAASPADTAPGPGRRSRR